MGDIVNRKVSHKRNKFVTLEPNHLKTETQSSTFVVIRMSKRPFKRKERRKSPKGG